MILSILAFLSCIGFFVSGFFAVMDKPNRDAWGIWALACLFVCVVIVEMN